jgi:hypothetical protein
MKFLNLPVLALSAAFVATPSVGLAWDHDDEDEIPFEEGRLFFELNDTDGDLGIHGKIDGDEWKYLKIEDPRERKMMQVWVQGRLRRQGLTELFFESAEPCFPDAEGCEDGLDPVKFFRRFPEGVYEVEGRTLDGEERENEIYLSHVIPAAPEGSAGVEGDDDCQIAGDPAIISWGKVTQSHRAKNGAEDGLGKDGPIKVLYYEVVAEIDGTDFKTTAIVPPGVTAWEVPEAFIELLDLGFKDDEGDIIEEIKYEILVRIDNGKGNPGNKSAMESCFEVE